ncbi:bifunctional aspartate kinase/homoserine dehydrogenase I [Cytophagaceae bacterium ABcell3]|nr:bifunctional aspartate kinase/homoserine dehydrogenase I [Cytophagaceae bacterium ABcell3]
MKVLKFGGTSVGSPENIRQVVEILKGYNKSKTEIAVVFSAMSGITNQLVELSQKASESNESYLQILKEVENKHLAVVKELIDVKNQSHVVAHIKMIINELEDLLHGVFLLKERSPRTLDLALSFGERLSAYIISEFVNQSGIPCEYVDARELIKTDHTFGGAKIDFSVTDKNIKAYFSNKSKVQIITGFISSTEKNETTTLGRGGSDYTASVIGAALGAEEIEIWTDVDGVMTADPRTVKRAFSLPAISYVEAMEMSHFGAKVIYPPTLQPAFNKRIPIRIRNTFNPEFPGTKISEKTDSSNYIIKGISSIDNISLVTLQGSGMVGVPGISARIFGALAAKEVNVIMITQASSEYSICLAVDPADAEKAKDALEEEFAYAISISKIDRVKVENGLSILAIIGENMRNTPGISGKLFTALGKNGINVAAIAQGSSEFNLSVVINKVDLSKALNSLHEAFFLSDIKSLNLYVAGVGLIGGTLLNQIQKQAQELVEQKSLNINIVAVSNSRKMLFNDAGIDLQNWNDQLEKDGVKADMASFVKQMQELNLPNSVFVDCTSSGEVVKHYYSVLSTSISVVTPNKLGNSGLYSDYAKLQNAEKRHGVKFLYETNVGAGLPVINTLRDLKFSGDTIVRIEGILSGTLSYIFNTFKGDVQFSDVVRQAKEKGFTEPDPRDDLNGMDVARKILILSREAGYPLEFEDVEVENILPESCRNAETVDAFLDELEKNNKVFSDKRDQAEKEGKVLRFIAKLENGKATVALESVDSSHPFYSLSGSDNMISFTTERYMERPLVIKGPGAGAEVTAAGVFAEIISISNYLKG